MLHRRGLPTDLDVWVLEFATALGLVATEVTLSTRPQTRHWHLRRLGESGTVEITADDDGLVLQVRTNRNGAWCQDAIDAFRRAD